MKLFCFGFGYTATALATQLQARGDVRVVGTRTKTETSSIAAFKGDAWSPEVVRLLEGVTHVLISIPPGPEGCPALLHFREDLAKLPSLSWVGYLSTVGVYGDADGAWVDEETSLQPNSERAQRRAAAEAAWLHYGDETAKRVEVFRLPGIYGPGRSVIDALRSGRAKRMIKPGQVFNRIHVEDIAGALQKAMTTPTGHRIFNLIDDEPCPPQDLVTYGAQLLGMEPPPETAFDPSQLTPMAVSFYSENKRVRNTRMKEALRYTLRFSTYREGILSIAQGA
jgi:nucleoside-diphosphate-sugar epimerase